MRIKHCFILLCLLLVAGHARAQEIRDRFHVNFKANSASLDPAFADNARQLDGIIELLNRIDEDASVRLVSVLFRGTCSLEGNQQLNQRLSGNRTDALEQYVRSRVQIPEESILRSDDCFPWEELKAWTESSDLPQKDSVLDIIAREARQVPYNKSDATIDERILMLVDLEGGRVWARIREEQFARMRQAGVEIISYRETPAAEPKAEAPVQTPEPQQEAAPEAVPIPPVFVPVEVALPRKDFEPRMHLKTNVIGWGMAMANIAAEFDLCRHWSISVPFYYSPLDYFTQDLKFRILAFYPELRYWTADRNDGFFANGHLGLAYHNFAFNGDYRYQDHNGTTPALGGGIGAGYRLPLTRHWSVEFAAGIGAYRVHYDRFFNLPDGKLIDTTRKTWFGLDQLSISFGYAFEKEKGR